MKPCAKCPFRVDRPGFIRPARGREIANALRAGGTFDCHETLDYSRSDEDEDGEPRRTEKTRWCAGALLFMEHAMGGAERNQMVRISQRLGFLGDLAELDRSAPVARSLSEWLRHLREGER